MSRNCEKIDTDGLRIVASNLRQYADQIDSWRRMAHNRFPTMREIKDHWIDRALTLTGGNRAEAARMLKVAERTIYRRLENKK